MSRGLYITLVLLLMVSCLTAQDDFNLSVGQKIYDYSAPLSSEVDAIAQLSIRDFDIPCKTNMEVLESQIPKVDFQLDTENGKQLIGVADNMVVWKGVDGPDPYLGVNKYFQFKDGVPLYNLNEPSDFNREGALNIYFDYKVEELPDNVGVWATIMEYTKLKVKVEVNYRTKYIAPHQQAFSEVVTHELQSTVDFEVLNYQAKQGEEWVDVVPDAHPSLVEIFAPITWSETRLTDVQNPLGTIIVKSAPESEVIFRSNTELLDISTCDKSGFQIYVYPNPTFGDITVRMEDNGNGPYTFELFNVVGHPILTERIESAPTIIAKYNVGHLDKGIYLYSIIDSRGAYLQTKRLVVVKR